MFPSTNGATTSIWHATTRVPDYPPLPGDIEVDVCVIGAGIAGLTTAYLLVQEGKQVVVIDTMGVGAGETGRTTAHFFPPDEWYADSEAGFGAEGAALIADSYAAAIAQVETIISREQIDCEFQRLDGYLYALPGNAFRDLDKELESARRAGVRVERLERVPGLPFDTGPCIRYANQAQFHPLKYLVGLAHAVFKHGGVIHGHTRALDITGDGVRQRVRTERGTIRANAVVVATNTPFNNRVVLHTKQAAYRTYVVGIAVPVGSVPRVLLWDTGDPYYYVRLESAGAPDGHEVLVVGGADHKAGQDEHPQHRFQDIERWVRERFPMAGETLYRWSGEVMEPADGPAYLGRNPLDNDNVYVITGDSGNGMTHCTIGGMLITDLVMGRDNRWANLYDPARKVTHGVADFVSEQANTLAQYGDWAKGGEVDGVEQIGTGQGAIINQGMHKLAVYRDRQGELHAVSARCTHLGCVVHFNEAETSWDCPCHGSRFAIDGQVLHGPAAKALAAARIEDQ